MPILTPEALAGRQRQNQDAIDRMVKSLDKEAHFIPYAPPSFVGFRQGAYLQLSINTQLDAPPGGSRYKQAALTFDDHISHLIRPLLDFFPGDVDFDGVDFSSVIHVKNSDDKRMRLILLWYNLNARKVAACLVQLTLPFSVLSLWRISI
jgi:hypothetical protein